MQQHCKTAVRPANANAFLELLWYNEFKNCENGTNFMSIMNPYKALYSSMVIAAVIAALCTASRIFEMQTAVGIVNQCHSI